MSVHVHRCERTDGLVRDLAELLAEPPADPFTPDVVAVPTRGIERFVAQEISLQLGTSEQGHDGVCANLEFPSPDALVGTVVTSLGGAAGSVIDPADDPWQPQRSVWPLLAVIEDAAEEPWCLPLAKHLGLVTPTPDDDSRSRLPIADRRFAVASRLARLFHGYGSQRPTLLQEWAAGLDADGAGGSLPDDLRWQSELWRRLRDRIGTPSPPERLAAACATLRADPHAVDLPDRLSVFGPSRLTAEQLAVIDALGVHRDVHLWIADASPALWERLAAAPGEGGVAPTGAPSDAPGLAPRRAVDHSADLVAHPLLRSMGRDARELRVRVRDLLGEVTDTATPAPLTAATLLGQLQCDLSSDVDPASRDVLAHAKPTAVAGAAARRRMAPDDRSVQVHSCHGVTRQAEVLREVVLGLLEDDPTLEPRDILVMCPDLATMAPLISAAFSDPRPGAPVADLRVRIADRTPEQANEVLAALDALLRIADGRVLLSEVLDLVGRPPVRTRFGFDDDAVARIEELSERAGVRWGLDAGTRAQYQLGEVDLGTWRWGLDRMLVGAALSEDDLPVFHGVLPLDDIQSSDIVLVGRVAEIVTRLEAFCVGAAGRHGLEEWVALLEGAVLGLMDARGSDAWQVGHALAAIAALARSATPTPADPRPRLALDVQLSLGDVRWMLAEILAGRPTRTNFRSGGLTACGLVPMRSVPHRVICLVGLDDGAFPRTLAPDGDDVLARDPRIGERDPRSEDRQVLLDAIMAAGEHLVITYTGADDRTNEPQPPCVPLGELLDALDATALAADGRAARHQVVVRHPLQPFDPRNFVAGALATRQAFSHDAEALRAARTALGPRQPGPPLLAAPLPVEPLTEVALRDLVQFLQAPAATFLRGRLGLALEAADQEFAESVPIDLDGLAKWAIGDRTVALLSHGWPADHVVRAEQARGALPPGALGVPIMQAVGSDAQQVADQLRSVRAEEPRLVPIRLVLPSGRRMSGAVGDVHGALLVHGTFSKPGAKQLIAIWVPLLALAVAEPGTAWRAVVVGKGAQVALAAPDAARAATLLDQLLDVNQAGTAAPLPLPVRAAMAYAQARAGNYRTATAWEAAAKEWCSSIRDRETGRTRTIGECTEPAHALLYGAGAPVDALRAERPGVLEDWYPDEETRFGTLARRIWEPLLAARTVTG